MATNDEAKFLGAQQELKSGGLVTYQRKETNVEITEVRRTAIAKQIGKNLAGGNGRSKLQSFGNLSNGGS